MSNPNEEPEGSIPEVPAEPEDENADELVGDYVDDPMVAGDEPE